MRCPADIKHYHVAQLARRLRGKYIDTPSENLRVRLEELETGQYDREIDEFQGKSDSEIRELYANRKIEAEASEK